VPKQRRCDVEARQRGRGRNLTGYDYLFTDEVRKQGLEHLEVIKKMILKSGDDRRAVLGDMTY
jgi:hypothetical protein